MYERVPLGHLRGTGTVAGCGPLVPNNATKEDRRAHEW